MGGAWRRRIERRRVGAGLSIIANGDVNDPRDERVQLAYRLLTLQTLDSPVKFLAVASKVFARSPSLPGRPTMIVRGKERGTVSSTLISLGKKPRDAIYQFANGAPDQVEVRGFLAHAAGHSQPRLAGSSARAKTATAS